MPQAAFERLSRACESVRDGLGEAVRAHARIALGGDVAHLARRTADLRGAGVSRTRCRRGGGRTGRRHAGRGGEFAGGGQQQAPGKGRRLQETAPGKWTDRSRSASAAHPSGTRRIRTGSVNDCFAVTLCMSYARAFGGPRLGEEITPCPQGSSREQVCWSQPAICSGDQNMRNLAATMRADARFSLSLQRFGLRDRSQVAAPAWPAR